MRELQVALRAPTVRLWADPMASWHTVTSALGWEETPVARRP